jgi:hypothetical protein
MYTFNPIADIPVDHTDFLAMLCGFGITLIMATVVSILEHKSELMQKTILFYAVPLALVYTISFHWKDQSTQVFPNQTVTATMEGYRHTTVRHRKSWRPDRHVMYVIYRVDDHTEEFPANPSFTYPQRAVLYRNP